MHANDVMSRLVRRTQTHGCSTQVLMVSTALMVVTALMIENPHMQCIKRETRPLSFVLIRVQSCCVLVAGGLR
jgi:hypothetical protein